MLTLGSIVSMLIGVASNIIIAAYFGTTGSMDAYVVALVIPNTAVILLITSLSMLAVPAFIKINDEQGEERAWAFATSIFCLTALLLTLTAASVIGFSDSISSVFATGFDLKLQQLTSELIVILAPMLVFSALGTLFVSIMQATERFSIAVYGHLAGSSIYLILLYILPQTMGIKGAAIAMTANYAAVLLFQMFLGIKGRAHLVRIKPDTTANDIKQIYKEAATLTLATLVQRFNQPIEKYYATMAGSGSASYIAYSARIITMVKNSFVRNVSKVFFPSIARHFAKGDNKAAINDIFLGVRLNAFLIIPLLAGISLLSTPFIRLLLERGAFTADDTEKVSLALICGSIFLIQPMVNSLTMKALYALKAIKFMALESYIKFMVFVGLIWLLMPTYGYIGIILAGSLNLTWPLHLIYIRYWTGPLGAFRLWLAFIRIILLSLLMWLVCYQWINRITIEDQWMADLVVLTTTPILGLTVYLGFAWLLKFPEITLVVNKLLKKKRKKS